MKKIISWIFAIFLFIGIGWLIQPTRADQPLEGGGSGGGGTPNDTSSVDTTGLFAGWGKEIFRFQHNYANLSFRLRILTRATNDSLRIYLQSTSHLNDTTFWVTFDSLGGLHTATGNTFRTFTWNATSDTLRYIGHFIRATVNHGFNAASSLATDTSRFYLDYMQWGPNIYQ